MLVLVTSMQRGGAADSGQHQVDVGVGEAWQVERNRHLVEVQDPGVGGPCGGALQCKGVVFLPDAPLGVADVGDGGQEAVLVIR